MSTSNDRIAKALDIALRNSGTDGAHHKTWVIDQMVRALMGCPVVNRVAKDHQGHDCEYEEQCESAEYLEWVKKARSGEDGPETYDWDVGIPP